MSAIVNILNGKQSSKWRVNNNRSEVVTLMPGKSETVKVTWLSGLKEAPEEVELKVVDHDTGEVLSKRKAKVSLLM
jgi:hypothetical protein